MEESVETAANVEVEAGEYDQYCKEINEPNLEGWEFFVESHGTYIYRKLVESSGLYEYKVFATYDDIPLDVFVDVYTDLQYRQQWDPYVKVLQTFQDEGKEGIYWEVKFPFPLSNRDYVYERNIQKVDFQGNVVYVVKAESTSFASMPEKPGIVRVTGYRQNLILTTSGNGTKVIMLYYDNPGGMIPSWLINWAAKTGVPSFLEKMQVACKGYPGYKAGKPGN